METLQIVFKSVWEFWQKTKIKINCCDDCRGTTLAWISAKKVVPLGKTARHAEYKKLNNIINLCPRLLKGEANKLIRNIAKSIYHESVHLSEHKPFKPKYGVYRYTQKFIEDKLYYDYDRDKLRVLKPAPHGSPPVYEEKPPSHIYWDKFWNSASIYENVGYKIWKNSQK